MPPLSTGSTTQAAGLRVRLLGAPQVERVVARQAETKALPPERRHQLVAWLALKGTWIPRAELAALLWPEHESKLALTNLRKALHRLQSVPWAEPLQAQGQALRFAAATDVAEFEAALAEGRLDEALALFRGELLEGFDDAANSAWSERLQFERERMHAAWRGAVLARLEQDDLDAGAAVALAARLTATDPLDEAALAAQMRVLARLGQLGQARAAYNAYAERLRSELGIAPGVALKAQHDALGNPAGADRITAAVAGADATRSGVAGAAAADGFVGRAGELKRIGELLAQGDCAALCLIGPGGVGKTRLAQRALQQLAPGFADGAAFVPLEDLPGTAEVGPRLAAALGFALTGKAAALDEVRRGLAARQMLLVLDNFEHLAAEAAWLDELVRECPRLKLIVTSRVRPVARALWTLPIEGLPCPEAEDEDRLEAFDAARLFVRAALRVEPALVPAAEAAAIVDICRQVEGLPLALELAASFTRVLSCEAIAAELREGTELLRTADPTRPPRQASLEAVFEQSWRHLAPVERRALARLAIFRGGFTPAAARSLAGASLPVLAALTDKSLVHKEAGQGGVRCHLHPLVQQFALQRLRESEPGRDEHQAVAAAHSRHFLRALAVAREPLMLARREAMRDTESEFENLRAAWRWAVAHGTAGADLARAAPSLMAYCDHRGRCEEGLQLLREGLHSAAAQRGGGDEEDEAQARIAAAIGAAAANLAYRLDRYAEAEALATRALDSVRRCGDSAAELQCARALGATCLRLSRFDEARRWYERALALAEDLADARSAAGTLDNLSLIERNLERHDAALDLSRRALLQHRALADAAGEALCLNNQGVLHLQRGALDAARDVLLAALQLCERHGLPTTRSLVEINLADLADQLGDRAAMQRHAQAALEISESCEQRAVTVVARLRLMEVALHRGDLPRARHELAAALAIALAIGRQVLQVNGAYLFASLLAAQGDRDCAVRVMGFALSHSAIVGHDRELGEARIRDWGGRRDDPAWTGPPLEQLAQRIVREADVAYGPLIADLRRRA